MHSVKLSTYISEKDLQNKVTELGQILTKKFQGTKEPIIAVCILKGSFIFFSDLVRSMDLDLNIEFFAVSSYHGTQSSGAVKVTLDLSASVEGKHVILVEDIVDTGLTMNYLIKNIQARCPKSLTTVSLLEKPDALKVECKVDYVGFKIKNDFVVGYGLDYEGFYRNLPYLAQLQNIN